VLVAEVLELALVDLVAAPKEAVPVERRSCGRPVHRRPRDVAAEAGLHPVPGDGLGRYVLRAVRQLKARARWTPGCVQVAGDEEAAVDAASDPAIGSIGVVLYAAHDEGRGRGLLGDLEVRQVRVAELTKRVVADREHSLRQVVLAGHREVPGQEEVVAPDARLLERREQALEM
jgi:hypothetical protein